MSSTRQIVLGLAAGIAAGVLLGGAAESLGIVADGYVRLLQMSVLPYVTVSLVAGIGSLDRDRAGRLFRRVGALTLVLWAVALLPVFVMPIAFPHLQSASFFSTTLVEEHPPLDFVALFIPANPFHSLANNVVPAVVLFSAVFGVALMGQPDKGRVIDVLLVAERSLARANGFVMRLTPVGLFAIAARTVGTIDMGQLARLRVYFLSYAAMALLLSLVIFPALVGCLTPISGRRVLQGTRDVLITAFVTGDLFIVLPNLIARCRDLVAEAHPNDEGDAASLPDVIVPAFYNFPHAAKLLSLSFVLFAAWYSETPLTAGDHLRLAGAGVASLFGSLNVAIPFLLDVAHVPADTFQLFLATSVLNARLGTLTAAMHMVVIAVVGSCAMTGTLRVSAPRLLRLAALGAGSIAATVAGLAWVLHTMPVSAYDGSRVVQDMGPRWPSRIAPTVLASLPDTPPPLPFAGASVLQAVRARGVLRVGYIDDQKPFSYRNGRGELVGFDVEMAGMLAQELGTRLELAPVSREGMSTALDAGLCDAVMGGVVVTTERAARMEFSPPYLSETLAFIVPDRRRTDFGSATWVRAQHGLRMAAPDLPTLTLLARREFPDVEIVPVGPSGIRDYFEGRGPAVDGLLLTAERGSFLTLEHPALSVAVPHPLALKVPLAYPVARGDAEMARFLGTWIGLKQMDGTIDALYAHWILGRQP